MAKVSVIMSAYNAEEYVREAVDSILNQSLTDFEFLVMDDGSSDSTLEILNSISDSRLKVFSQKNSGKAVAINSLLDKVTGEYLTIQDADDSCDCHRLKILAEHLDKNQDLSMVLSGYALIINGKRCAPRRKNASPEVCNKYISRIMMPGLDPTIMVRSDIAKVYRFDPELKIGQGFDFILRVGENHKLKVIPDILYHYRFHYASISKSNLKDRFKYILKVVNSAKERRREPLVKEEEFFQSAKRYWEDKDNNLCGHFTDSAYWSAFFGFRMEALRTALLSLSYLSFDNINYIKPLIYACLPMWVNNKIKGHNAL